MKRCARCKIEQDISQFNKNGQQKDGRHVYCKSCVKKYSSRFYQDNRDTIIKREQSRRAQDPQKFKDYNKRYRVEYAEELRDKRISKMYGLSLEEWSKLFERQHYRCAICQTDKSGKKNWSTDHDHRTKKVRGILCSNCNNGLGRFKDNVESLLNAAKYLKDAEEL